MADLRKLTLLHSNDTPRCISTSDFDVIEEYLKAHTHLDTRTDGRITLEDLPVASARE